MRIAIVTPVRADSRRGNGVTARRWQQLLVELGHEAYIREDLDDDCDLLLALHARRSAAAIASFAERTGKPIVLAMTGTDLYVDLPDSVAAQASMATADRIVVLQPLALERLPPAARAKTRVIFQSVDAPSRPRNSGARNPGREFVVSVLAHMRDLKDPLCAARAAARLSEESAVQVTLAGAAPDDAWRSQAVVEAERNPRFAWAGELSAAAATELLLRSHVTVVSSRLEGGANVLSEAIVRGVPVLATRIDGNVGLLGPHYGGYFPFGADADLAELLRRAETEPQFLAELTGSIAMLQPEFEPAKERQRLQELLGELV